MALGGFIDSIVVVVDVVVSFDRIFIIILISGEFSW